MKKIIIVLIALILPSIHTIAQDSLHWSNTQKLTWGDFKGTPDTSSALRSLVVCKLPYHYHKHDSILIFTISCFFLKKFSWNKPPLDSAMLVHAQGHFDIAEICTGKIRQRLVGFIVTSKDWKQQLNEIILEGFNEKDLMNERYDRETENGSNEPEQNRWNTTITNNLNEYVKFD